MGIFDKLKNLLFGGGDGSEPKTPELSGNRDTGVAADEKLADDRPIADYELPPEIRQIEPSEWIEKAGIYREVQDGKLCAPAYADIFELFDTGKYREAAELCKERLKDGPNWTLYILQAYAYKLLRKTPENDRALTASLELDPDNILVLRTRCRGLGSKQRFLRHIQDLDRLLELDPDHACAYLASRAYYHHWTGDDEGAKADLRAILERTGDPEQPWVLRSCDFRMLAGELLGEIPQ